MHFYFLIHDFEKNLYKNEVINNSCFSIQAKKKWHPTEGDGIVLHSICHFFHPNT